MVGGGGGGWGGGGVIASSDSDVIRVGRMLVFCCELLVSQNPHDIARCGRLRLVGKKFP